MHRYTHKTSLKHPSEMEHEATRAAMLRAIALKKEHGWEKVDVINLGMTVAQDGDVLFDFDIKAAE